jgi:hypothetical protein
MQFVLEVFLDPDLGLDLVPLFKYFLKVALPLAYLTLELFDTGDQIVILPFLLASPYVSLSPALDVPKDTLET